MARTPSGVKRLDSSLGRAGLREGLVWELDLRPGAQACGLGFSELRFTPPCRACAQELKLLSQRDPP